MWQNTCSEDKSCETAIDIVWNMIIKAAQATAATKTLITIKSTIGRRVKQQATKQQLQLPEYDVKYVSYFIFISSTYFFIFTKKAFAAPLPFPFS